MSSEIETLLLRSIPLADMGRIGHIIGGLKHSAHCGERDVFLAACYIAEYLHIEEGLGSQPTREEVIRAFNKMARFTHPDNPIDGQTVFDYLQNNGRPWIYMVYDHALGKDVPTAISLIRYTSDDRTGRDNIPRVTTLFSQFVYLMNRENLPDDIAASLAKSAAEFISKGHYAQANKRLQELIRDANHSINEIKLFKSGLRMTVDNLTEYRIKINDKHQASSDAYKKLAPIRIQNMAADIQVFEDEEKKRDYEIFQELVQEAWLRQKNLCEILLKAHDGFEHRLQNATLSLRLMDKIGDPVEDLTDLIYALDSGAGSKIGGKALLVRDFVDSYLTLFNRQYRFRYPKFMVDIANTINSGTVAEDDEDIDTPSTIYWDDEEAWETDNALKETAVLFNDILDKAGSICHKDVLNMSSLSDFQKRIMCIMITSMYTSDPEDDMEGDFRIKKFGDQISLVKQDGRFEDYNVYGDNVLIKRKDQSTHSKGDNNENKAA